MSRKLFTVAIAFVCTSCAFVIAAEDESQHAKAVEIPLDQIWASEMPGAREVRELEPKLDPHDPGFEEAFRRSRVTYILEYLSSYTPRRGEIAGPAFVVTGSDLDALEEARRVFRERTMEESTLPHDKDLSLVIYSYPTGWHPRITSVTKSGNEVRVKWQFVARQEPTFGGMLFALIPIGKFSKGNVRVEMEEVPPIDYRGRPMEPKSDTDRFVCRPFSFYVQ